LGILKQKEDQGKEGDFEKEAGTALLIQAEMEALQQRSKIESKVHAKALIGKKDVKSEVSDLLVQEWEKTANYASELVKH